MDRSLTSLVVVFALAVDTAAQAAGPRPPGGTAYAGSAPIAQQAYLKASNPDVDDGFGVFPGSVAVWRDTAVVGAANEESAATGVDGDGSDDSLAGAGAAYVYVRDGDTWTQQAYLKASNTDAGDTFGSSVAVWCDTIVVGATGEDSSASGVDGDESDDSMSFAGAVYVFERVGTTWSQTAYLKASNPDDFDSFGTSLAIDGDTIVVGATGEDSAATTIDGNQVDDSAASAGAAYVFVRDGDTWVQQAYLKPSNTDALDFFGHSVDVSGDTIVVGAFFEDSSATDVDGNASDNSAAQSGAAYVFIRDGSTWSQQAYLKASNTQMNDNFGLSVSVSGDTVVVGATSEDSAATGVDGNQFDNTAASAGAAYVFVRSGSTWAPQAYLKASNTGSDDFFGGRIDVDGERVVVGAFGEDSNATGVDGNGFDNSAFAAGAAYVFQRDGSTWSQEAYLKASNTDGGDGFANAAALSGDTVLVGAGSEDSGATGVDGNQSDDSVPDAGAAYAFDLDVDAWFYEGCGLAGVSGEPRLDGDGTLGPGTSNTLELTNAAPGSNALFVGLSGNPTAFKGGTLLPVPPVIPPIFLTTGGSGELSVPFTWPTGVPGDTGFWFQFAIVDAAAPNGVALSNGLVGITP